MTSDVVIEGIQALPFAKPNVDLVIFFLEESVVLGPVPGIL